TMNGFAKVASQADPAKLDAALILCREQADEILRRERLGSLRFAGDLVILDANERGGAGSPDILERVCSAASDIAIALEQLPAHASMMGRIQVSGGVHLEDAGAASSDALQQAIALAAQASKAGTVLYLNSVAAERVKIRFPAIADSLLPGSAPGALSVQFFHLQQVMQG
nr:hypothetical protein [Bryobacterales bacterium]